jgi:endonuclease/exonuclease/phosphatase family metal-dependent hydrolase
MISTNYRTKAIQAVGGAVALALLIPAAFLIFLTATDYRPEYKTTLAVENNAEGRIQTNEKLTIVTSNVGYGAIDDEMNFFLDGGTLSRAKDRGRVFRNISGIIDAIGSAAPDFILAQEIDLASTRSYKVNEYDLFKAAFKRYGTSFAVNLKIPWIPVPILKPHGRILAGQATFADKKIAFSERISLPIEESWPRRLWALDNCLLETRIAVENRRDLVIYNAHLSAYDEGGVVRKKQLGLIKSLVEEAAARGDYVILGGDFNHAIPGSDARQFAAKEPTPAWYLEMPREFNPRGYRWEFDQKVASNRTAGAPYTRGENFLSIVDGFMVSDNIEVVKTAGIDAQFKYSDHNPVAMTFRLK